MASESFGKFIVFANLGKEAKRVVGDINSNDLIEVLQDLLKAEYLQRDIYESYRYLLFGAEGIAIKAHLEEHMVEEMVHIDTLQRYIVSLGGIPTLSREEIPTPNEYTLNSLLEMNLAKEKDAVEKYSIAIKAIENMNNILHAALLNDLEDIVSQEQEHVHDLERWLKWVML